MQSNFKNKQRAILCASMLSLLSMSLNGCNGKEHDLANEYMEQMVADLENSIELLKAEDRLVDVSQEINGILCNLLKDNEKFIVVPSVMAKENVNIRTSDVDGELIGTLVSGSTLEIAEVMPNGWYKVFYYDKVGYIKGDYVKEVNTYKINRNIQKVCYVKEETETEITIPKEVSMKGTEEHKVLPELECLEVYEENEDNYLVQTNDYIGYVPKTNLGELEGTFVTVDISEQELKLYENNEVILKTPVVTGQPSKDCATHQGLFPIYNVTYNRYLKGPGYASYVDVMMKFYNNEGLHPAEFHTHENGDTHGWRTFSEMGGDTYLTNGSHGCVNMPYDAVMEVADHVVEGATLILIKD